jgi:sulfotransferase family protein
MPTNLQVFILGPARSGTSITYYAMREIFGLSGDGESHVMPIFQRILHDFRTYQRNFAENDSNVTAASLYPIDFRHHIVQYIRTFYARKYPEAQWVDKTPGDEAILGAPLIQETFPSAKVICTRRTGIEVVQSFRAKFSSQFAEACQAWALSMNALLKSRESCPHLLEVDQFDMTNAPEEVARAMTDYLGAPERWRAMAEFFRHQRTDRLSSHDWSQRLTLRNTDWSDEERTLFVAACGELMQKFDYPL